MFRETPARTICWSLPSWMQSLAVEGGSAARTGDALADAATATSRAVNVSMFMAGQGNADPDWIGSHDAATDEDANLPQAGLTDATVRSVTMTSGRAGLQA